MSSSDCFVNTNCEDPECIRLYKIAEESCNEIKKINVQINSIQSQINEASIKVRSVIQEINVNYGKIETILSVLSSGIESISLSKTNKNIQASTNLCIEEIISLKNSLLLMCKDLLNMISDIKEKSSQQEILNQNLNKEMENYHDLNSKAKDCEDSKCSNRSDKSISKIISLSLPINHSGTVSGGSNQTNLSGEIYLEDNINKNTV